MWKRISQSGFHKESACTYAITALPWLQVKQRPSEEMRVDSNKAERSMSRNGSRHGRGGIRTEIYFWSGRSERKGLSAANGKERSRRQAETSRSDVGGESVKPGRRGDGQQPEEEGRVVLSEAAAAATAACSSGLGETSGVARELTRLGSLW